MHDARSNYSFNTCLIESSDSDACRDVSDSAQKLVWSFSAPMTPDNRKALLRLVPRLLPKLRTGLESISFNPYNMTQLFKGLEALHLDRLRSPGSAVRPDAEPLQAKIEPEKAEPVKVEAEAVQPQPAETAEPQRAEATTVEVAEPVPAPAAADVPTAR